MRVFLTGGTGLLGSHLAGELISHGHHVVALHRSGSDTAYLEGVGAELVEGDVRDERATVVSGMDGCTHLVHGAALVYAGGGWPTIRAINVDGTANIFEAAVEAGLTHAVHVSSVTVYGSVSKPVDESASIDTPIPVGDLYARSKREAEAVVREVEGRSDLAVTVVRPSAVYGERDRLMAPAVADVVRRPVAPLLGPGDNSLPVVYAGNVAVALRLVLEAGLSDETLDIGFDHPLTQRLLFSKLAEGMGEHPRLVSIPASIVRGGAGFLARLGVGTPGAPHLPLDRVARLALGENPFPSRRVREVLGWDPPHRHEDALVRTGRDLVAER